MNKEEAIKLINSDYPFLRKEFGIYKVGLFGSITRNDMLAESDIDLIVEFNKPIGFKFYKLVNHLENLFGRKVDVLTPDGVKNIRVKEIIDNIQKDIIYV